MRLAYRYDHHVMQSATARPPAKRAAIIEARTLFVPYLVSTLRRSGLDVVQAAPKMPSRRLARLAPDVVLVGIDDVPAPLAYVRRLRRLLPEARIVLHTYTNDPAWALVARGLGASVIVGPADDEVDLASACAI